MPPRHRQPRELAVERRATPVRFITSSASSLPEKSNTVSTCLRTNISRILTITLTLTRFRIESLVFIPLLPPGRPVQGRGALADKVGRRDSRRSDHLVPSPALHSSFATILMEAVAADTLQVSWNTLFQMLHFLSTLSRRAHSIVLYLDGSIFSRSFCNSSTERRG